MTAIKDRLFQLFTRQRTTRWFEDKTGIERYRWSNIKSGKSRLSDTEIEAVVELFPEYALWLVSGKTAPEVGQISPTQPEDAPSEQHE